jgi:hypothetical protein
MCADMPLQQHTRKMMTKGVKLTLRASEKTKGTDMVKVFSSRYNLIENNTSRLPKERADIAIRS